MIKLKDLLNEGEIKMIGNDQDELIDAITFVNNGVGKGNQKVKLPFGNNTLKALDKDGKRETGTSNYSIKVKPTKAGPAYIKSVNDFLDDHGFECRLVDADDYKKAALEMVALANDIIKKSGESLSMGSEVSRASKVDNDAKISSLYGHLIEVLGNLIGDYSEFEKGALKIMLDKYNLYVTNESGFNLRNK